MLFSGLSAPRPIVIVSWTHGMTSECGQAFKTHSLVPAGADSLYNSVSLFLVHICTTFTLEGIENPKRSGWVVFEDHIKHKILMDDWELSSVTQLNHLFDFQALPPHI